MEFLFQEELHFNVQQNFEIPLSISAGGTFLDVYSIDENGVEEEELFVSFFFRSFFGELSIRDVRCIHRLGWKIIRTNEFTNL